MITLPDGSHQLTIMVSSAVYENEIILNRVYDLLNSFGYKVWMSCKGTIPINPHQSTLDTCLSATENCDLFLCLITPQYGSGRDGEDDSFTHQELTHAIKCNKLRWFLAHDHVVFARSLLNNLKFEGLPVRAKLQLTKKPFFEDLRILDMYDEITDVGKPLSERKGNWVQQYTNDEDVIRFVTSQFSSYQEKEKLVQETLRKKIGDQEIKENGGR